MLESQSNESGALLQQVQQLKRVSILTRERRGEGGRRKRGGWRKGGRTEKIIVCRLIYGMGY